MLNNQEIIDAAEAYSAEEIDEDELQSLCESAWAETNGPFPRGSLALDLTEKVVVPVSTPHPEEAYVWDPHGEHCELNLGSMGCACDRRRLSGTEMCGLRARVDALEARIEALEA